MAPTDDLLSRRYYCPSGTYYSNGNCYNNSSWYFWGRWVLAGVIIFVVIAGIVCLGCINSRRRRRQGLQPRYGTGWMSTGPKYGQNNEMYPPNNYQPGPPPYQPQPQQQQYTGNTFNPNEGYYGGHQQGVQYPDHTYQRDNVYAPPAGPPPGK